MNKVLITADAVCDFPPEIIPPETPVMRREIITDKGAFKENLEMACENVLEYIRLTGRIPEIVAPSAEDYREFFLKQLEKASALCHFACGSSFGESCQNAVKGAQGLRNVFVIDSKRISGGIIFQVAQGLRLAAEGFSPEFIVKSSNELETHINSSYASGNTDLMRQCGAISSRLSSAMDFFGISPTVTIRNGGIISGMVLKNGNDFYHMYIKKILKNKKNIDRSTLIITCPKPYGRIVQKYKAEIAKYCDFQKIAVTDISASIMHRLGEDSLGLHFMTV